MLNSTPVVHLRHAHTFVYAIIRDFPLTIRNIKDVNIGQIMILNKSQHIKNHLVTTMKLIIH